MNHLAKFAFCLVAIAMASLSACDARTNSTAEKAHPFSPATHSSNAAKEPQWFTDEQKFSLAADKTDNDWIAVWFGTSSPNPDEVQRHWRRHQGASPPDASRKMNLAVELLADPPPGARSAFRKSLDVIGVELHGTEVLLNLDGSSPGLEGHATDGLILGSAQLKAIAGFYFPEAESLCIAFDGIPTSMENLLESRVKPFLHDAIGCPIEL